MNRKQLVSEISSETGLTKKQSDLVLDKITSIIQDQIKHGRKVTISGFGTFDLGKRVARSGINPQTGKRVKIAGRKIPRFRAGTRFKKYVNQT